MLRNATRSLRRNDSCGAGSEELEVLDETRRRLPGAGTVFPTPTGRTQPHPCMVRLLHELEIDAVPHGFRSSFRDWAAECTDAPREVCELALAHVSRNRPPAPGGWPGR